MRTKMKRILSIALALCICLTMLPNVAMQVAAADPISMMVSYAQDRVGKTGAALGYNVAWCALFVSDCAAYAGQSSAVPKHANAHSLYFLVLDAGGKVVSSPQAGDLVFYNCSACDTNGDGISMMHVGLVENANYSIEGNLSGKVQRKGLNDSFRDEYYHYTTTGVVKRVYVRPAYSGQTPHTHSYTGVRVYENAHPHRISQRCADYASCGGWIWTDEYKELKTCEQCWHADFDIGASSISIKVGESKTVSASLSGCLPDTAVMSRDFSPDNDVVEVTVANQQMTFTGLKAGTTNFSLTVYSDSSKSRILGTVTIPVTVISTHTHNYTGTRVYESEHPHRIKQRCVDYENCGGWIYTGEYHELSTCQKCWYIDFGMESVSVSIKVGESKTVNFPLSGCLPDSAAARSSFSPDNGVVEVTAASKQLTFTGLKAGSTNFTVTVYSDNTKSYVIGSMTIPVTVTPAIYTISYNANGGTGAPDDQTKYHGTTLALSSTIPTRSGYTFIGWSTSSSATSASYQPGGSFTSNATTTLYAVWRKGFYGDVYQDGVLNNNDILHMNKIRLGKIEATNWEMFIGDLDGDGSITQDDIELLNSFRVGTITAFPVDSMNRKLIINTYPQVDFCLGTKVDISGLSVFLYYPETMAAHDITDYCDIQLPSTSSTGTKTVYISFDGLNTDYTVKVTGHTYSYKVANTPTASAMGSLKGSCSECSSITTVTLPKLTTTDYTYEVKTAATCTTDGIGTYTWKITTYGEHIFQVTVPATGHAYFSYVTEPDCTSNGYTTYVCLLCLLSYKDNHTKALGHTYVNGVCIRCDEEDPAGSTEGYIPGDISGDGNVNIIDVAKLYAHVKGTNSLTNENSSGRCDISGDGKVNIIDVAKLYAYVKGTSKLY